MNSPSPRAGRSRTQVLAVVAEAVQVVRDEVEVGVRHARVMVRRRADTRVDADRPGAVVAVHRRVQVLLELLRVEGAAGRLVGLAPADDRGVVAVAQHQRAGVADHVVVSGDEVLGAVGAADGGLVDDHQAHLVGHVEHVGAGGLLVDADHVVVQPLELSTACGQPPLRARRRQEAGQRVVGVAHAAVVDPVVVGALEVVAAQVHAHAVEVVVRAVLRELPESEPVRGVAGVAVVGGRRARLDRAAGHGSRSGRARSATSRRWCRGSRPPDRPSPSRSSARPP